MIQVRNHVDKYQGPVSGMKTSEFKQNVTRIVNMTTGRRDNLDMDFDVVRRAADEWHTVKVAEKI